MVKNKISEGIHDAHERVAKTYGLKDIHGYIDEDSYDAWNLKNNVELPLKRIIENFPKIDLFLDAGCGNGQISEILLKNGVNHVIGADFSSEMLSYAENRLELAGLLPRFSRRLVDLMKLDDISDSTFDGVLLFGVLEHLDDPETVISNLLRKTKPGGSLILAVPRRWSLSHFSFILFGDSPNRWGKRKKLRDLFRFKEKANFYRFYSPATVESWLSCCSGFQLTQKVPFAHIHIDGLPGFPLRVIGRNSRLGHSILNALEKIAGWIKIIPAGEFWIIRRV